MDDDLYDFLAKHPFIPPQFIAFDAETTGLDANTDKIIELAAIKFSLTSDDHPVFEALVNPGITLPRKITDITGITNQQLQDKEAFADLAHDLSEFIGDLPIVAYNAKFDKGFLLAELARSGITLTNRFHCAMNLSKLAFNLPNYKLATVSQHCKIPLTEAHRAKADAVAAGRAFICAAVTLGHIKELPVAKTLPKSASADHKAYPANERGKLFGQTIVFTGELAITRAQAFIAASQLGLEIKTGVSKKTTYLVVGKQDAAHVGSAGISSKQIKAQQLKSQGINICILDEDAFMAMTS